MWGEEMGAGVTGCLWLLAEHWGGRVQGDLRTNILAGTTGMGHAKEHAVVNACK